MGLNKYQNNEAVRALTLKSYLITDESKEIVLTYAPLKRGVDKFLVDADRLDNAAKDKQKTKAVVVTKKAQKKRIAYNLGIELSATRDYATQVGDTVLFENVSYTESTIVKMNDADILPFVLNLSTKVFTPDLYANITFKTYNVTVEIIGAILDDAIDFNKKIGGANKDKKAVSTANDELDLIIDDIHVDIKSMEETIVKIADEYPMFYNGFNKNKELPHLGTKHQGKKGYVRKNGVAQPGAIVRVEGEDHSVIADEFGYYEIYLTIGVHPLLSSNANGDSQRKSAEVSSRKMTDMDFDLE